MDLLLDLAPDDPGAPGWMAHPWLAQGRGRGGRTVPAPGRLRSTAPRRGCAAKPGGLGRLLAHRGASGALLFPWKGRRIWGLDGAGGTSKRQHSSGCCGDAGAERESSSAEPGSVFELQIQTQRGKNPGQSRGDASPDVSGGIRPCLHTQHAFIH